MDWDNYFSEHPEILLALFIVMWSGISLFLSRMSGWAALAGVYRARTKPDVYCRWFQSARMRWGVHFNGCLTIGANMDGLYLSMFLPFRIGHPPLFIPWADIIIEPVKRFLLFDYFEFRFNRVPDVPLQVRAGLGEELAEAAGSSWPGLLAGK